jgi:hypothetical protein
LITKHLDEHPTVVCAWCNGVLEKGGPAISHGICHPCAAVFVARAMDSEPASISRKLTAAR